MAILESTTVSKTKVKIRWKEPYVSEALNRAMAAMPHGIYHGFNLAPGGGVSVQLTNDSDLGDSLALIYDSSQNLSFAYRDVDQPTYDLTAYAGSRVYAFIYVDYAVGSETDAEIRLVDAAELGNPWLDSAISLGSVRVPSSGNIAEGDIEQATADFAGLASGQSNGWTPLNDNPAFTHNFAGYEAFGDDVSLNANLSFVTKGANSLLLGRGSSGAGINSRVEVPLNGLEEGDKILVKWKMAGNAIAGDTTFNVTLRTDDTLAGQTDFLSYDVQTFPGGTFEEYGYYLEVPALEDDTTMIMQVGFANTSDTGQFFIDELEILQKPKGEPVSPAFKTAEKLGLGTSRYSFAEGYATVEESNGGASFNGSGHTNGIDLIDGTYTQLEQASVAELSDQHDRNWQGLDSVILRSVIQGGGVVDDGSGTAVDVSTAVCRNTSQNRATSPEARAQTFSSVNGLAIDTSEDNVVYADFSTDSIEIEANSTFTSQYDYVPLAYVNVSGGTIDSITDLRDFAQAIEEAVPITLQGSSSDTDSVLVTEPKRMLTLEGALKYAEIMYPNGRQIVIDGEYDLGDVSAPITLPSKTTIKGATPTSRLIYNTVAGSEDGLFYIDPDTPLEDVTIADLRIEINADGNTVQAPIIGNDAASSTTIIRDFTLDNLTITNNGAGSYPDQFVDIFLNSTTEDSENINIRNCNVVTENTSISLGSDDATYVFDKTKIVGCNVESVSGDAVFISSAVTPTHENMTDFMSSFTISDCFLQTSDSRAPLNLQSPGGLVSNCALFGGAMTFYATNLSNCNIEVRGSATTGLELFNRSVAEGCYLFFNSTGTYGVELNESTLSACVVYHFSDTGVRMENGVSDDDGSKVIGSKILSQGDETFSTIRGIELVGDYHTIADTTCRGQTEDEAIVALSGDYFVLNGVLIVYVPGGGTGTGYNLAGAANTIEQVLYQP